MPDDSDPPRKFYTMKAKEIERLNPAAGEQTTTGAINVRDHLAQAAKTTAPRAKPVPVPPPLPANDVVGLVQANAAKEQAAGLNEVAIGRPRRTSRRKRDYFTTLFIGNGLIIGAVALAGINAFTLVFGLAGIAIFTGAVSWVIWQVMDDY